MNSLQGIEQLWPNQAWKGVRIIRIDDVPNELPSSLNLEILSRCQLESVSVELFATTAGGAFGELSLVLLLRSVSEHPYEVKDRLDRAENMVRLLIKEAGITCHVVQDEAGECGWLARFFGGDLTVKCTCAGFFPPENPVNSLGYYVPGRYGSLSRGVPLARLLNLLSGYPNAFFAVQANTSPLYLTERNGISYYNAWCAWYAGKAQDAGVRAAAGIYSGLNQESGQPHFFINFFCAGDSVFTHDMIAQAQLYGLRFYNMPPDVLKQPGYALHGDDRITAAAITHGHEPHNLGHIPDTMGRLTHMATLKASAAAFSFPDRTSGIKGLKSNAKKTAVAPDPLPAEFADSSGICLGTRSKTGQKVYLGLSALTRHGLFVGKPGSGKTTFALGLLAQLQSRPEKLPFLAIEPAKKEYRCLMEQIPDLRVYTPGDQSVAPMQLNPFLPPRGVRLEQFLPSLESIFAMSISMVHPLDIIFPQVIRRCYTHYGWRPDSTRDTEGVRIFGMHEFIREFRAYTHENYGSHPESLHSIENGGIVRLKALMDTPLFDTNNSIDIDELLNHPTVVELDAIDKTSKKALVMGILLTQIMLVLKQRRTRTSTLRNLILVDEAHLLLSQGDAVQEGSPDSARAVREMLQNMTLILRAYGTALMFGDQSPTRLSSVILNNVNLKLMFRLDSVSDRQILKETARLNSQMVDNLAILPTGEGYMYCDALDTPVLIVTPNVEAELRLNKALPDDRVRSRTEAPFDPPFYQCARCGAGCAHCDPGIRSDAKFVAECLKDGPTLTRLLSAAAEPPAPDRAGAMSLVFSSVRPEKNTEAAREAACEAALVAYLRDDMDGEIDSILSKYSLQPAADARFRGCVKAQLIRALLLDSRCKASEEALLAEAPPKPAGEA